jgi:hypothetical protein
VGLARWAGPARAERAEPFSCTFLQLHAPKNVTPTRFRR